MNAFKDQLINEMNKDRCGISYWVWPGKPNAVVKPSFDSVMAVVAEVFDMSAEDIISKTRRRDIVIARQMVCLICREVTDLSYKYIGYFVGGRDHSTVIHGHNTMKEQVSQVSQNGEYINPCIIIKVVKTHGKSK